MAVKLKVRIAAKVIECSWRTGKADILHKTLDFYNLECILYTLVQHYSVVVCSELTTLISGTKIYVSLHIRDFIKLGSCTQQAWKTPRTHLLFLFGGVFFLV